MDASDSKVFRTEGSLLLKWFSAINSIYHNCMNSTFELEFSIFVKKCAKRGKISKRTFQLNELWFLNNDVWYVTRLITQLITSSSLY